MLTFTQDSDGFIRMPAIVPNSARINVVFADGSAEVFTGARLNELREAAYLEFRRANNMDAKGFNRNKGQVKREKASVQLVPVTPGLSTKRR